MTETGVTAAQIANAQLFIDRHTRGGKSLAQVRRYDLAGIALTLGYSPCQSDTKASLIAIIEQRMSA
jgi:hypothetical protein